MSNVRQSAVVPYSAEQMYELVNDIESYPEFLPWCSDARIERGGENSLEASVTIATGRIHQSFATRNTMVPGRRIDVHLVRGPFRHLSGSWVFEPAGDRQCRISLEMEFEFKNRLVQLALGKAFHHIVGSLVDAFTRRAREIHG